MLKNDESIKIYTISERINYIRVCEEAIKYCTDQKERFSAIIDGMSILMSPEEEINHYRELYQSNDKLVNFYNSIRVATIDSLINDPEFVAYTSMVAEQNNIPLVNTQTIQSEQSTFRRV